MTCPRCQTKIAPSDRYCINCGADIALISQNIRPADMIEDEDLNPAPSDPGWSSTGSGLTAIGGSGRRSTRYILLGTVYLGLFFAAAVAAHWYLDSRTPDAAASLSLGKPRLVTPGAATDQEQEPKDDPGAKPGATGADRPARRSPRKRSRPRRQGTTPKTTAPTAAAEPKKAAPPATEPATALGTPVKKGPDEPTPAAAAPAAKTKAAAPAAAAGPAKTAAPAAPAPSMGSAEKFRVSLNVGSVQMVVRHYLPQLRLCYGRAVKGHAVRGTVEIKFTVNEQGKVSSASVHRGHKGVGGCIVGKLKTWRFPRPVGGEMTFIYPFGISGS